LFDEIASAEGLEVSSEEIDEELQKIADSLNQPVEKVSQIFSRPEQNSALKEDLLRRKALDLVITSATINS
jgi:trigger factor